MPPIVVKLVIYLSKFVISLKFVFNVVVSVVVVFLPVDLVILCAKSVKIIVLHIYQRVSFMVKRNHAQLLKKLS